jgi:cell division protein FtsQ
MAKVGRKKKKSVPAPVVQRVSPLKPGLRGARNWATAQLRMAGYSRRGMWRLVFSIGFTIFLVVLAALWLGGFLGQAKSGSQTLLRNQLISMGFTVDHVDVVGEGRLHEADVKAALGIQEGDYLFDLDLQSAQARVEALNWVETAIIRRLWPDRIVVQIIERDQYALWQSEGNVYIIDAAGVLIARTDPSQFQHLPFIVGAGAAENIESFKAIFSQVQEHALDVKAFVHYGSGRWDLQLSDGDIRVKLPVEKPDAALARLADMQSQYRLLDRDLKIIDLRINNRVTLSPNTERPV